MPNHLQYFTILPKSHLLLLASAPASRAQEGSPQKPGDGHDRGAPVARHKGKVGELDGAPDHRRCRAVVLQVVRAALEPRKQASDRVVATAAAAAAARSSRSRSSSRMRRSKSSCRSIWLLRPQKALYTVCWWGERETSVVLEWVNSTGFSGIGIKPYRTSGSRPLGRRQLGRRRPAQEPSALAP